MSLSRRVLSAIEPGSCLAKAEGREQAHDQLQRALNEKLDWLGRTSLYLLGLLGGREGGYLFDDTIIERRGPGKLGLPKLRTSQGLFWLRCRAADVD